MNQIELLLNKINRVITLIGGAAIALMMIHITADIIARFFINKPLPGTITFVAHYYMIIAIFLPLAYTEQCKAAISVELISGFFSPKMNKFVDMFGSLFVSVTAFLIMYVSWGVALKNLASKTSVMQGDYTIPTWPSYFILCFGAGLLGVYCLVKFFLCLMNKENNQMIEEQK
ncbi:TRAP transporter small permease [Advenella sp. RU8]|uniref:TRAP transporter small permease n=1 Tax=Advenella sp. RU8 TaxID=3399575 RepID=UPI003AAD7D75